MLDVQSIVFELTYDPEAAEIREARGDSEPRWFWVNQGQTWNAELAEGILWAPLLSKNGQKQHHWERMDELRPGDMVIHYSGAIRAVSRVDSPALLGAQAGGAHEAMHGSRTGDSSGLLTRS